MPDWRKPAEYAFTENLTPTGWAWEFLRRNPEYREGWKTVSAALKKHGLMSRLEQAHRWGLVEMYDPFSDEVGNAEFLSHRARLFYSRKQLDDRLLPKPEESYAFAVFDLSEPLPGQLAWVKTELRRRQRALREKGTTIRNPKLFKHPWPDYLRALDAHLAGEKSGAIGAAFWPGSDPEFRRAKARERLEQALLMAQVGYRDLLHQTKQE